MAECERCLRLARALVAMGDAENDFEDACQVYYHNSGAEGENAWWGARGKERAANNAWHQELDDLLKWAREEQDE